MKLSEMTLRQIRNSFKRQQDYWISPELNMVVYDTDPESKRILVTLHGVVASTYKDEIINQYMLVLGGEETMYLKLLKVLKDDVPEYLLDVSYRDVEYFLPKLMTAMPQYSTLRGELRHHLVDVYDSNTDTLHTAITKKAAASIMRCNFGMILDMLPEYACRRLDFDGFRIRSHRNDDFKYDTTVERDSALFKGIYLVADTYNDNEVRVFDDLNKAVGFINSVSDEDARISMSDMRQYLYSGVVYTQDINGFSCRRIDDINGVNISFAQLV